jgi:ketosteroid isomerase-like protein
MSAKPTQRGKAMSENLDLVRSIFADWERGDFSSAGWADPEIEWVFADGPTPGAWRGSDGLAHAWGDFLRAWQDFRIGVEGFRELDAEQVLVFDRFSGRGKTSGLDLGDTGSKGLNVFHLRHGKVTRIARYFSRERALADLGLEE